MGEREREKLCVQINHIDALMRWRKKYMNLKWWGRKYMHPKWVCERETMHPDKVYRCSQGDCKRSILILNNGEGSI